mgnify:CR=1 FL=1
MTDAARRNALLDRLKTLLPAHFEEIVFKLDVPAHFISHGVPQATRAGEVLRYLAQQHDIHEMERLILGLLDPAPDTPDPVRGPTYRVDPGPVTPTGPLALLLYAKRDAGECEELLVHLAPLRRSGAIELADPHHVDHAGRSTAQVRRDLVDKADLVLVLVTHNLFADDALLVEIEYAARRAKKNETRVIPILVRSSQWKSSILGGLAALPQNEVPVALWRLADEAWHSIAEGLREVALKTPRRSS